VLGGKDPDEVVEKATEKLAASGGDVVRALEQAEVEYAVELEERRQIKAKEVKYNARRIDPFGVLDVVAPREPGWHKGRLPTHKQKVALEKFGLEMYKVDKMSFHEASSLMDGLIKRSQSGLASYKQCRLLKKHGVDTSELDRNRAGELITRLASNGWRHL
jgi:hypothetical protein